MVCQRGPILSVPTLDSRGLSPELESPRQLCLLSHLPTLPPRLVGAK